MPEQDVLQTLYPFLHGTGQEKRQLGEALLESVRRKAEDSVTVKRAFFADNAQRIAAVAEALADIFRRQGRLFVMGNGGSSCDAAHIAVEFLHPVTTGRPALPAINLAGDNAMLTAVGNDVGFGHVYVRQLHALARSGDALIGVSTSGNSDNLLKAFATAKQLGLLTIGLAGHEGGAMAQSGLLDHCLVVSSDSIHRVQETHVALYHILWDLVHTLLADDRGSLRSPA